MQIIDWFDPYNIEHIKAYKYLFDNGMWPEGFIPEDMFISPHWQVYLAQKMANAWVNHMLYIDNLGKVCDKLGIKLIGE